mmetsp:Transcript_18801/g.39412  ORF Transcript_18801/g.39412 Transcript_18801/m.39412 type:complete len:697 (+) Transcript_18801:62-2152(+)
MPASILLRVALLALLSLQVYASKNAIAPPQKSLRSCDESFPQAPAPPPDSQDHHRRHSISWGRERRLVAIGPGGQSRKFYETGEYYAPLCPDDSHIDIRKLYRCNAGSCWNEEISQCTFECTWNAPSPRPTGLPTRMVAPTFPFTFTENPLLLSLKDLSDQYRMNAQVRQAIIDYLFRKLKDEVEGLPFDMELITLTYAGRLPGLPHDLPLNAKVRGPPGLADVVLDYIQQLIRDNEQEIVDNLKKLDGTGGEAMKNARVVAGTYNVNDIVQGEAPTNPPTNPPTSKLTEKEDTAIKENSAFAIPWWVWLIAALVILLCCTCYICGVLYYRWMLKREKDIEQRRQINHRVENRPRPRRPAPSFAESRATRTRVQQSRNHHHHHHHAKRPATRSSRAPQSLAPTRELVVYKEEAYVEPKETRIVTRPIKAFDSGTAVSNLSPGFDPGAEYAMVVYDRNPRARDPTYYTDRMAAPDQIEPEGDIADASLMSDVRSQMEEARREREAKKARAKQRERREIRSRAAVPDLHEESFRDDEAYGRSEGALDYYRDEVSEPEGTLSDDLQYTKKKKKKKKKSKRKSHKNRASSSKPTESPIDDNDGATERHSKDSDYDSPSILTNHANLPEAEIEKLQEAGIYTYAGKNDDGYDGYEHEEEVSFKTSERQDDHSEDHLFSSLTRKSSTYDRDGISSCDESYHA